LKPLGSPHYGPDKVANILVLCPNHHIMFDRGALRIEGPPLVVIHESAAMKPRSLYIQDWHVLSPRLIQYHNTRICGTV
jgi:putative restriction endonuclease